MFSSNLSIFQVPKMCTAGQRVLLTITGPSFFHTQFLVTCNTDRRLYLTFANLMNSCRKFDGDIQYECKVDNENDKFDPTIKRLGSIRLVTRIIHEGRIYYCRGLGACWGAIFSLILIWNCFTFSVFSRWFCLRCIFRFIFSPLCLLKKKK